MKKIIIALLLVLVVSTSVFGVSLNISTGYFLSNIGMETKVDTVNLGINLTSMFPNCVIWETLFSRPLPIEEILELCEFSVKNFGIEAYVGYDVLNKNNRIFLDVQGRLSLFHLADEFATFFSMLSLGSKFSYMNKANTDGFMAEIVLPLVITDFEEVGFLLTETGLDSLPSMMGVFFKLGYKHNF